MKLEYIKTDHIRSHFERGCPVAAKCHVEWLNGSKVPSIKKSNKKWKITGSKSKKYSFRSFFNSISKNCCYFSSIFLKWTKGQFCKKAFEAFQMFAKSWFLVRRGKWSLSCYLTCLYKIFHLRETSATTAYHMALDENLVTFDCLHTHRWLSCIFFLYLIKPVITLLPAIGKMLNRNFSRVKNVSREAFYNAA